ncbi:unnamed protein product, partial [Ixodes hexagonus]
DVCRHFQVELFEGAKEANTIVCLGTGTGKTFIAVMLIKELEKDIRVPFEEGGKRTFFLVPTVPLVVQQQKAIQAHTSLSIGGYIGDMNVDNWDANRWHKEFVNSQVLVMTPEIFKIILHHGFLALSRVNLLIFDECHRAVKQHTYREIMRCMDVVPQDQCPRVMGLTASVINSKATEAQVESKMHSLEMAMRSRVLTVSDQASIYGTKPQEVVVEFHSSRIPIELPEFSPTRRATTSKGEDFNRRVQSVFNVTREMGLWCGQLTAQIFVEEARKLLEKTEEAKVIEEVSHCLKWLRKAHAVLSGSCSPDVSFVEHRLLALVTPKLKKLLEVLRVFRPTVPDGDSSLCGIVFVKERVVARVLCAWLSQVAKEIPAYGFVRPHYIVGHASTLGQGAKESGMPFKRQCKVGRDAFLRRSFRRQECNLLVATSVVEEGMDVPKCSLVVRFDFPPDYRSYVQSKGRARAKRSFYLMMVSRDDCQMSCASLQGYHTVESILMTKCHKRKAPLDSEVVLSFAVDELLPPYMPVKRDGAARITMTSAIGLVNRYCVMLPSDIFTRLQPGYTISPVQKEDKEYYVCTVYLPMTSPLKEPIQGQPMETKRYAKMAAALETCKRLHQMGELDDNMLPVKRTLDFLEETEDDEPEEPGVYSSLCLLHSHVAPLGHPQVCRLFREPWVAEPGTYRLHVLTTRLERLASELQNWRKERLADPEDSPLWFGILLQEDMPMIPSFPIFTRSGEELVTVSRVGPVQLSAEQCERLQRFHRFVCDEVMRVRERPLLSFEPGTAPNCVTLTPVMQGSGASEIDWPFVDAVLNYKQPATDTPFQFRKYAYEDAVVVPQYHPPNYHHRTYYVKKVRRDVNPESSWQEGKASFSEYLSAAHNLHVTDRSQPLLEVSFTEVRLNLLTPRYRNRRGDAFAKKTTADRTELRVPEFCNIHPIPASVWRKAVCLPGILYRINQLLLAEEIRSTVAAETGIGLRAVGVDWPPLGFQSASFDRITGAGEEVEFGTLLRGHGDADVIRMPRISKSFEYQPELEGNPGPSPGRLLEALTSAKAADGFDLERLEVLGDSFLKFAVTIDLYSGETSAQEGLLTQARSRIISNRNLHRLGCGIGVGEMAASEMFDPHRNWLPPGYRVPEGSEEMMLDVDFVFWALQKDTKLFSTVTAERLASAYKAYKVESSRPDYVPPKRDISCAIPICTSSQLPDKSVADSVEALIGAYLLVCGPIGALKVMKWMGLRLSQCDLDSLTNGSGAAVVRGFMGFPPPQTALLDYTPDPEEKLAALMEQMADTVADVEKALGYTFADRSFLLQAVTHASYYKNRLTDCYQRLEFLGDAVIDYLVTRYLYEVPKKFNPGQLTDLRSSLVNNTFFASLVVKYGLHRCFKHCNPSLFSAIGRFVNSQALGRSEEGELDERLDEAWLEEARQGLLDLNAPTEKADDDNYWKVLERHYCHEEECQEPEEVEVPKALGDLFESLIGAVFLDCGMSLDRVWHIIYRMFGREIESFTQNVPVPPVRELVERFPDAKFSPAEILSNNKVKVQLTVTGKTFACVAKSKKLAKMALAKKCLRMVKQCGS